MKKIGCCLLLICMLLPMLACNTGGGETTKTPPDDKPLIDMGGYEYNAYIHKISGSGTWHNYEEFDKDDRFVGTAVSLAAYERNRAIELAYNCKITYQYSNVNYNQQVELGQLADAGKTFEIVILPVHTLTYCATMGLLRDLNTTQGLDLTKEYFDQNSVEQLSLGTHLYFVSGDMNISAMDLTKSLLFNQTLWNEKKEMVADKLGYGKYEDLYGLVDNGEWTIENMYKIAAAITEDADPSDGALSYEKGDIVGYMGYGTAGLDYFYASGGRLFQKDSAGLPTLSAFETATSKELYSDVHFAFKYNSQYHPSYEKGEFSERMDNMESGKLLFSEVFLWEVRYLWNKEDYDWNYGLLPMATLEGGESKGTYVDMESQGISTCLWSIPVKCANAEYATEMLEVMARRSGDTLIPAYKQSVVCARLEEKGPSYRTLESMKKTMVYDSVGAHLHATALHNFYRLLVALPQEYNNFYDSYVTEESVQAAKDYLATQFEVFRN